LIHGTYSRAIFIVVFFFCVKGSFENALAVATCYGGKRFVESGNILFIDPADGDGSELRSVGPQVDS